MRSSIPARQQANHQRNKSLRKGYSRETSIRWTTDLVAEQLPAVKVVVSENVIDGRVHKISREGALIRYEIPFGPSFHVGFRYVPVSRVLDHLNAGGAIRLYPTADTAKRRKAVTV